MTYNLLPLIPSLDDKPENYFEMTYKLTEKVSSTELEIIQEDNRSGAKQEAEQEGCFENTKGVG